MSNMRLYGRLFHTENRSSRLEHVNKRRDEYHKRTSHIRRDTGEDITGQIKISCFFDYTKEKNPITVRCFWSRHEFPERGEMYDLEVLFFYKAEKSTGNFVSLGEIKNQELIKTLPSAIDLRPIRNFKTGYTGWVESQELFKTAMKTPSPENKRAWNAFCKEKEKDNG